jgi:hypothetical protein
MLNINRYTFTVVLLSLIISSCSQAISQPRGEVVTQSPSSIPSQSNLPPLNLGSIDDINNKLNSLYQQGGITSVVKWAEKELQPGREVIYEDPEQIFYRGSDKEALIIYNRVIWRVDAQGNVSTNQALLPLLNLEKPYDFDITLGSVRRNLKEPFALRLRLKKCKRSSSQARTQC